MTRYLLELTLRNPATGTDTVLRLTERSSYTTRPADTPAQAWYKPYAKRLVNYETDLFAGGKSYGGGGGSVGEALLNNASRWLDPYQGYAWRSARILQGPLGRFVPYSAFTAILSLSIAGRDYVGDEVSVRFREGRAAWDRVIPRATYAGTNSGPVGLEGNADLAGRVKPLVLGFGLGCPVEWVNPSLLIAQWHNGPVDSLLGVTTGGASVTYAGDVGSGITIVSLPMTAGTFVSDNSRGLIRFASQPLRKVAVDGFVLSTPNVTNCAAQVAALFGSSDPISFESGFGGRIMGWLPDDGATGSDVLDAMAAGAAAWWRVDQTGTLRGGLVPDLTGAATFTIAERDIAAMDLTSSGDEWGDVPVWRVVVEYSPNWTVLAESEIDPSVTSPATRRSLMRDWRFEAVAEDAAVVAAFPDARELRVQAPVISGSTANEIAARLLTLHGVPRSRWIATVSARIAPGSMPAGRIGNTTWRGQALKFLHTGTGTEDGRSFSLRMFE
ncbi:hypothetical protein [Niveispirillum sp. KHB5.9]|uniref:hypothetical protein n=1 Tax=Niveispirillum sp. KHB5.9 TaxID=3400269 RepID=UPI003A8930D7